MQTIKLQGNGYRVIVLSVYPWLHFSETALGLFHCDALLSLFPRLDGLL